MCHIIDYQRLYRKHCGQTGAYHLRLVRLARELIAEHYRTCPDCRGIAQRSNYNLVEPVQTRFYRPKGEAPQC